MTLNKRLFTSESVTEGHPDKMSDQISDAVLDAILEHDPLARVACEVTATTGLVLVAGEITTTTYVDIPAVVRQTIKDIGYTDSKYGFDAETCGVLTAIDEQSRDIATGVDSSGAGDQGLMFGYATDETKEYMPLPIYLAHMLAKQLTDIRKNDTLDYLRPDGKTQVTIEYNENDEPIRVDTIVISTQHDENVELSKIQTDMIEQVVKPIVPVYLLDDETKYHINPTGRFVVGGPQGDVGLTGRKIIVDTYGGVARHGGGAFSGKDPTKVDRAAAYAARYVAKNIVAAKLARKCEVQLAYAIGVSEPVSIAIDTFGTSEISESTLVEIIRELFNLSSTGIIEMLDLNRPIYRQTASYGHFGRNDLDLPWEALDKVASLQAKVKQLT